jgi:hypothetical protein
VSARGLAVVVAIVACGGRASPPEVALTGETAVHPTYGVRAKLPAGWIAEAAHAPIYPADTWTLRAPGVPPASFDPSVTLILGWLPRGGRQSAFFPGEREDGARRETRVIGGAPREGLVESRSFLADFDVGDVAVSIRTYASDDAKRAIAHAVVAQLAFDPVHAPPTAQREALELARAWAAAHDHPTANIVYVGQPPGTKLHAFTLFHDHGLVPLRVDLAAKTVTEAPL